MIRTLLATAALTALATTSQAEVEGDYISLAGHQYTHALADDGTVSLTSLYPVARFTGFGASMEVIMGTESLYLGRNCDAYSKVMGEGKWSESNGGFRLEFDDLTIIFPRQEIETAEDVSCMWN